MTDNSTSNALEWQKKGGREGGGETRLCDDT